MELADLAPDKNLVKTLCSLTAAQRDNGFGPVVNYDPFMSSCMALCG